MYGLNFEHAVKQALRKYQWASLAFIRMPAKNRRLLLIQRADGHFWSIDVSVPMPETQAELDNALLIAAGRAIREWKPKA